MEFGSAQIVGEGVYADFTSRLRCGGFDKKMYGIAA